MILLLKISILSVCTLLIFTRNSILVKFFAGAIFIFNLIMLYRGLAFHSATIFLAILGILYTILTARFFTTLASKRQLAFARYNPFLVAALTITGSFIFLKGGLRDPFRFSMLIAGLYLFLAANSHLDVLLAFLIFATGIFFLNPVLTIIIVLFMLLIGISGFFIFGDHVHCHT